MSALVPIPQEYVERKRRHRVVALWGKKAVKLFSVQFEPDGSLFVHFPYQPDAEGLAAVCTLPKDGELRSTPSGERIVRREVHMTRQNARVTSHRVKYSHHVDGRAHFSQNRRVETRIVNHSRRLDSGTMHLFSIEIEHPEVFEEWTEIPGDREGTTLFFVPTFAAPEALHVTGMWTRFPDEEHRSIGELRNPLRMSDKDGEPFAVGMAVAPPQGFHSDDYFLHLQMDVMRRISKRDQGFMVMFTGGFRIELNNPDFELSFLALSYPSGGPEDFETIDLPADLLDPRTPSRLS